MHYSHRAGGIIIHKKTRKVVIVNQFGQTWSFPKGGIEDGETELEAATREIHEETGIQDLALIRSLGSYERYSLTGINNEEDPNQLINLTFFLFESSTNDLVPQDKENPEALWVDFDEIVEKLGHSKDREFFLSIKDSIASWVRARYYSELLILI